METTTSPKTPYREIARHSSVYMIGMILTRLAPLVMIPLYTHYLTPDDYGVVALLVMTGDVIAILISMGLSVAVFRFYAEKEQESEKKKVVSTALVMGNALFFCIFGTLVIFSSQVSTLVFGSAEYTYYFQLTFVALALQASIEIPLSYLRARSKSSEFVIVSIVRTVLQLTLNVVLIAVVHLGILGILYSTLTTFAITASYLMYVTIRDCGITVSRSIGRQLVSYGYPLVFSNMGEFILTFSDRFFLKAYTNLTEVGLYTLGYKFGMFVSFIVLAPFHQHWSIEMFKIDKRPDREEVFRKVLMAVSMAALIFIFMLSVFIKEIVHILASPSYLSAYKVVPIVALGYYYFGLARFFRLGAMITKRTKYIAYSTSIAAVVNVLLNLLLIPRFGMFGAGAATVGSFFVQFAVMAYWSNKLYPVSFSWTRLNLLLLYAIVILLVSYSVMPDNILLGILKDSIFALIFLGSMYFFWMRPEEKNIVRNIIRKPRAGIRTLFES